MEKSTHEKEVERLLTAIDRRLQRIESGVKENKAEVIDEARSYSRRQAAAALGVSLWTIDAARKRGELRLTNPIGERDVRISGKSLIKFQREREARQQARVQIL